MNTADPEKKHGKLPVEVHLPHVHVDEEVVIPGDPEKLAEETAAVSPEGRPADPKLGPRALRMGILVLFLLVVCLAVVLAIWVNVLAGAVALILGSLGLLLNPVVGATTQRAEEREAVAAHHQQPDPEEIRLNTTSSRKSRITRTP